MRSRRRISRRKRRAQADILISVLNALPSSKARKPANISRIAEKSGATWRTAKKNIDMLIKAGIIERVKEKGKQRIRYKKR